MTLSERMKRYEAVNKTLLPIKSFVMVRVDGKKFSTYTKGLKKPFDEGLINAMNETTIALCKEMQNAIAGYVQSDEISILMYDAKIQSETWLNNEVQKIVSISASIATEHFNSVRMLQIAQQKNLSTENKYQAILNHIYQGKRARFDSRVFVLPNLDEVINYFLWRYNDCCRNSVNTVGQTFLGKNKLYKKNVNVLQEMLFQEKNINWSTDFTNREKRGGLCLKGDRGWEMVDMPHVVCDPSNEFYQIINQKILHNLNK